MRRIATALVISLLLLVAWGPTGTPARAEDEGGGDTPAERAWRDGWWAETTSGRLEEALTHYLAAHDREGPAAVRARALYRAALVLERMGRTEEAMRTLERLEQEFPAAEELLVEARERLAEWTAVDLRDSFEEWYRRYQYSPEFQARVVDHVLELGGSRGTREVEQAEQALLTIGAPAIPALRAHVESPLARMRENVTYLLLRLGEVPPADVLASTLEWRSDPASWRVLLDLDPQRRTALRDAVARAASDHAELVAAALGDDEEQLEALRMAAAPGGPSTALLGALLPTDADAPPTALERRLLEALPSRLRETGGFVETIADALRERRVVSHEIALDWIRTDRGRLGRKALVWVVRGEVVDEGAWRVVVDALVSESSGAPLVADTLMALQRALADAPPDADLEPAVRAFEHVWTAHGVTIPPFTGRSSVDPLLQGTRRLYAATVDRATDASLAFHALKAWVGFSREDSTAPQRLLAWALTSSEDAVRQRAAKSAGELADADSLPACLEALSHLETSAAAALLDGLSGRRGIAILPWTDARLLALQRWLQTAGDGEVEREALRLFARLLESSARLDQMLRLAIEKPDAVWLPWTQWVVQRMWNPEIAARARHGLQSNWGDWTSSTRLAALLSLGALCGTELPPDEFVLFVRGALRASDGASNGAADDSADAEVRLQVKRALLAELARPEVADLRAAYDFEDPAQAMIVASLQRVERTPALYEQLQAARRHPAPEMRAAMWQRWIEGTEDLAFQHRLALDMFRDPDPGTRRRALAYLFRRESAADVPVFVRGLQDEAANVRETAAKILSTLSVDASAIAALVKALDDPVPRVRDAALASLEAIRKFEEQKEYWRRFAEGAR